MARSSLAGAAIIAVCASMAAAADEQVDHEVGVKALEMFLEEVKTLQAQFDQLLLDDQGQVVQESTGTLLIKRPGKFRWEYREPYEQLVLSDGANLWIYDSDLEQATVKPIDDSLATTPAMLLSGGASITESFDIERVERSDELLWIHLKPKAQDTDFRAVTIGFDGTELRVMELTDSLDQLTWLQFNAVIRNPELDDEPFTFVPPEGVDVIGELAVVRRRDEP